MIERVEGSRLIRRVAVMCLLTLLATTPARAQDDPGYAREGVYVGFGGSPTLTFNSEQFLGNYGYISETDGEIAILPTVNKRAVPRVVVGFRSRPLALEFSYDRSRFEGDYLGLPLQSVYNAINVDGKFFFRTLTRVQPHIVLGMAFPWLNIEDGAFPPGSDPLINLPGGDAGFRGPGLNTEIGVTAFATSRLGVSVGYAFRAIWFNRVRGIRDEVEELRPPFRELRGTPVVAGFFTF